MILLSPSIHASNIKSLSYKMIITQKLHLFLLIILIPQHLFTCELNGKEASSSDDCVAKLKSLESRGKIWGQDMILQVQSRQLQLCDVETKVRDYLIAQVLFHF